MADNEIDSAEVAGKLFKFARGGSLGDYGIVDFSLETRKLVTVTVKPNSTCYALVYGSTTDTSDVFAVGSAKNWKLDSTGSLVSSTWDKRVATSKYGGGAWALCPCWSSNNGTGTHGKADSSGKAYFVFYNTNFAIIFGQRPES